MSGYYLSSATCLACGTGMATCTDAATADTCVTGYTKYADGNYCVKLSTGASAGTVPCATKCNAGYYLSGG